MTRRAALIVLDGLGIGPAHDQARYGDTGSDTSKGGEASRKHFLGSCQII